MRLQVKKWGNGLAVRLPRESKELGRLEPGTVLDVKAHVVRDVRDWRAITFKGGPRDLSVRHDEFLRGVLPWY